MDPGIIRPRDGSSVESLMTDLRRQHVQLPELDAATAVRVLSEWGELLSASGVIGTPGMVFLRLWLRRTALEGLVTRELGEETLRGDWQSHGAASTRSFPVGLVGHFPAGNVPIQPLLSAACGILGGNATVVRVPSDLADLLTDAIALLGKADRSGTIIQRAKFLSFPSSEREMLEAMARGCDGAMVWGGEQSVMSVRSLPFPHWARLSTFGPRISMAIADATSWTDAAHRERLCQRLARDVWQFEQRACSSPQILYVERDPYTPIDLLLDELERAFVAENRAHPRLDLSARAAVDVAKARAEWMGRGDGRMARYPTSPDWTILAGSGLVETDPVQNKCLFVSTVDELSEPIDKLDGNVQAIGMACSNTELEKDLVQLAARRGVDRITPVGRMHIFDSPWDGKPLIAPMTRLVRHTRAA